MKTNDKRTELVRKCLVLLENATPFTPDSGPYVDVRKGLSRLTLTELEALYAMLLFIG